MTTIADAVARRRTFAIISHPDAGKTTLTEKLLLAGGAIQLAGEVKARGERRRTRSDWMKVERERGISVSASVMTFAHRDCVFNLLDTPGHEDFSEDTYRTLTAVDSAVMVLDAAKGIESQTRKLFEVCRLRNVPIVTFINKLDRDSRDPFDLLDEIEQSLALDVAPATWPVGAGRDFRGLYDLWSGRFVPAGREAEPRALALADPGLEALIGAGPAAGLRQAVELARGLCPAFDPAAYRGGHLSPVFFGSALRGTGVAELIAALARFAPPPGPVAAKARSVAPTEDKVSGFVFKVLANMDPNHRDRVAFVRLCSGHFRRGMKLRHARSGKQIAVYNPVFFLARERELAEEAFAGDIIGIQNHGQLRIGDSLSEGEELGFGGVPSFAPEMLMRVRLDDPLRAKHLRRALSQLAEEGVTQVFRPLAGGDAVVGAVGALQFEVLAERIADEYAIKAHFEPVPVWAVRWVDGDDPRRLKAFADANEAALGEDHDGALVFLARNAWHLERTRTDWPEIRFLKTRETEQRLMARAV